MLNDGIWKHWDKIMLEGLRIVMKGLYKLGELGRGGEQRGQDVFAFLASIRAIILFFLLFCTCKYGPDSE